MKSTHDPRDTCTNYAALDSARFMCREHMAKLSEETREQLTVAHYLGPEEFLPLARLAAAEAGVGGELPAVTDNRKAPLA